MLGRNNRCNKVSVVVRDAQSLGLPTSPADGSVVGSPRAFGARNVPSCGVSSSSLMSVIFFRVGWPQSGPELVRTDEDRELDRWSGPGSVRSDVLFARSGPRSFEGEDGPDQSEPKANL